MECTEAAVTVCFYQMSVSKLQQQYRYISQMNLHYGAVNLGQLHSNSLPSDLFPQLYETIHCFASFG